MTFLYPELNSEELDEKLTETLTAFIKFLRGGSEKSLKKHMKSFEYDQKFQVLNTIFHKKRIHEIDKEKLTQILKIFSISKEEWAIFLQPDLTLYKFLKNLTQKKSTELQTNLLIRLVDNQLNTGKTQLLFGGITIAALLFSLFTAPAFSRVIDSLKAFLLSPTGLPILGLIFNTNTAVLSAIITHSDKKRPLVDRIIDNFFMLTGATFNIVGYSVWIASASALSPFAATLFLAASAVDVFKEGFGLRQLIQSKKNYRISGETPLEITQDLERYDAAYSYHIRAGKIKLVASLILVGIMALWCFAPPTLFLTIGAVGSIGVVYISKSYCLRKSEEAIGINLQQNLNRNQRVFDGQNRISSNDRRSDLDRESLSLQLKSGTAHEKDLHKNSSTGPRFFDQEIDFSKWPNFDDKDHPFFYRSY